MKRIEGGYALVLLTNDCLVALRDPDGLRPLALGQLDGAMCVASETCAFDAIGATFVRDVAPGEMIVIDDSGLAPSVLLRRRARRTARSSISTSRGQIPTSTA